VIVTDAVEIIRVLIVDDHPVVRTGLSTMLQKYPQIAVAATVCNGEDAIRTSAKTPVDIVLLDLRMPGMSGLDTLRQLHQRQVKSQVIILSSFELDEEIHQAVLSGARGYLVKDTSSNEIVQAICRVHSGSTYFPKRITNRLENRKLRADLSKRELEILEFVAKGFTNKEIAKALRLSQFTVRNHLNNITTKLEATDRTEAAFIAIQTGIIPISH
jgi:DNA-binding NarL/FixJ family response regulator